MLLLLTLPVAVEGQFTYSTNNGTIAITKYSGPGGAVIIPSEINGMPVKSIDQNAFDTATGLTSVEIPNSITNIGDWAFPNCTSMTNVTFGTNLLSIGDYAFSQCSSLTNITIPNSVTQIGKGAFWYCSGLASITIPNRVSSIGLLAFSYCSSMTEATIGSGVTNLSAPLSSCSKLVSINVDPSNTFYSSVDGVLFDKDQTTLVQYPAGKAASSYTIPTGITKIGYLAFIAAGLTSLTIPNSVTTIEYGAFSYCSSLTNATIGTGVTNLSAPLIGCSTLLAINVAPGNMFYSSVDGILFNKEQTTLVQYPAGKGENSYTIPDTVTGVQGDSFNNCHNLNSITIPDSVTDIEYGAFRYAFGLTSITIPDSVTNLGSATFMYCTDLASVTIGNRLGKLADNTFAFCSKLTNVTLPSSVTNLGSLAFEGCSTLRGIYFEGNAPGADSSVFMGDNSATVYYLPGTRGWDTIFASRPTALWSLPYPLILNGSIGAQSNQFGFTVSWAKSLSVVVEASIDLANPSWSPVASNSLTRGTFYFSDPQWTNHASRFYRVRSL